MTLILLPPISLHKPFIFLPVCICSHCSLRPKYLVSSHPPLPQFNSCPCSLPDAQPPGPLPFVISCFAADQTFP